MFLPELVIATAIRIMDARHRLVIVSCFIVFAVTVFCNAVFFLMLNKCSRLTVNNFWSNRSYRLSCNLFSVLTIYCFLTAFLFLSVKGGIQHSNVSTLYISSNPCISTFQSKIRLIDVSREPCSSKCEATTLNGFLLNL